MAKGFRLEWTIEGETQISRVLQGLIAKTQNLSVPFKQSADYLKDVFSRDVFSTEGRVIGEQWQRLSPYTVAQKARQGYPLDILVRTGAMKKSFVTEVGKDFATIGNTAEYFKYHQSNQPRHKIPRRVMMKLANNQKEQVVKYFQAFLRSSANA